MPLHSPARWLAAFGLLCAVTAFAAWSYGKDLAVIDDDDLSSIAAPLVSERNALAVLTQATKLLAYPVDYTTAADRLDLAIIGAEWDESWTADVLKTNESSLALFGQAQATPDFQIHVRTVQGEGHALGSWITLAKLRALQARAVGLEGRHAEAIESLLSLARFGARIRELDGGRMVHYLTGTSVIRIALDSLRRVLRDVRIDRDVARAVNLAIDALRLNRDGWARIARGDYQWNKAVLDESIAFRDGNGSMRSRDPFAREVLDSMVSLTPMRYSLQRNRTLMRLANHYRESMASVPSDCLALETGDNAPAVRPRAPRAMSVERNAVGDYWADLTGVSIDVYRRTSCVSESMLSAVQVMVALRAFEVREGHMPLELDSLVPEYLASIPLDYFDGNPIRYSPDRHLIYSVGSDFADSSGEWHPGEPCNSELPFPIPFATETQGVAVPLRVTCAIPRS